MIKPYEQPLLEAGGGIIDTANLAPQPDCATIAIGLGGTGADALRRLKTKVHTRVRPDDPDAAEPAYSHIRFLAVDTDSYAMHNQTAHYYGRVKADDAFGQIDLQREFFDISYRGSIPQLFREQRALLAKDPCFSEWLQFDAFEPYDEPIGVRQVGRFLLFRRAGQFVETLKRLMTEAKQGLGNAKLYVHIFSGLCGGTGSGILLDVCYLVRYAISQLGVGNATVTGYLFLPDVSMRPGFADDLKAYLKANGYAAMQELDYCMGFGENGDSWHQEYPGVGLVESSRQPVDLCCLVSGPRDGNITAGSYASALDVAAESALALGTTFADPWCRESPEQFLMYLREDKWKATKTDWISTSTGAIYDYVVLGVASAVVPRTRIMAYLAAGALRGLPGLLDRTPTEEEALAFGQLLGLTYENLYQRVTSHANMSFPAPDARPRDARDNERLVIGWFTQVENATEGTIKANTQTLAKPLGSYSGSAAANAQATESSLMAALLRGLRQAMADPQRGPAWAAKMVAGGGGCDVLAQLDGIRATAQGNLEQENFNLHEKPDNYFALQKQYQAAFEGANFLTLGKAYKYWVAATKTLVESEARCAAFRAVIDVVEAVMPQVRRLASEFAQPFQNCVARLDATFQANVRYLDSLSDGTNECETPIVTMAEVRPSLDATLRGVDCEAVEYELVEWLLSDAGMAAWGPAGDDQRLAHIVSAYFSERFHNVSSRSLTDYLQAKYGLTDQGKLADRVYNGLLAKVNTDATPLFWNEVGYNTDNASHFEYVTVPNTAPAVVAAAERLGHNLGCCVRRVTASDCVSVVRAIVGVPLWGYAGTALYETRTDAPGRHLYQPANRVEGIEPPASRNWNLLPSPTPWTIMRGHEDSHDKGTYERAEEAVRLFDEGLRCGVLGFANAERDLCVHIMTDDFMRGIRADYERGRGCTQETDRIAWRDKIQAKDQDRVYEDQWSSPHLYASYALTCFPRDYFVDVFVRSPVIQSVVRRELAKVREIQGYIEELSPWEDADLDDVCTALFTGVVKFEEAKKLVTYTDEWGEETVLSKKQMDRGGAPLYQAYLSYRRLPEYTTEEIRSKANEIVNADELPEDEVLTACRAVREELRRSDGETGTVAFIKVRYPAEARECKEVLQVMSKRLDSFLIQHMIEL